MSTRRNREQGETGYDSLIRGFTAALELNSNEISVALEQLAGKEFSEKERRDLRRIQNELKNIDRRLSKLG